MTILWEGAQFDMHANFIDPGAMNIALSAFHFLSSTTGPIISHEAALFENEKYIYEVIGLHSDRRMGVLNPGLIFYSLVDRPTPCSSGANIFHCHEVAWFLTS